jgi:hypothetical protein
VDGAKDSDELESSRLAHADGACKNRTTGSSRERMKSSTVTSLASGR